MSEHARGEDGAGHGAREVLMGHFESLISILDSLNATVYVAAIETHELLFMNAHATSLFGDGVGGRCFEVLQAGQSGRCAFCTNHRLVVDGIPGPAVVWEFQNTVNRRWFLCIDKAIPWWDGRLVRMELAVDITDRKLAERFRDEYVGVISHDLRNPLSALVMRALVLEESLEQKGLAAEAADVHRMITSATQMDSMIADLLETSRLEAGRVELRKTRLDLRDQLAQVVSRIAPPADRARVELSPDAPRAYVDADAPRLDRVIDNLLSNALKYSGDQPVSMAIERSGAEAVVSISDRGVGVPADELPRLFDRFYRASTAGAAAGVGLGLCTARQIVEAHGGRIWIESDLGCGTTVRFTLPLAEPR